MMTRIGVFELRAMRVKDLTARSERHVACLKLRVLHGVDLREDVTSERPRNSAKAGDAALCQGPTWRKRVGLSRLRSF